MIDQETRLPVFVYGTLLPGETNYDTFLKGKTVSERPASVRGVLYLADTGDYPFLRAEEGTVQGVLMDIRPECFIDTLRALDGLEEYFPHDEDASVYLRRESAIRLENGKEVRAWVYYWNETETTGNRLDNGDFRQRKGR